MDHELKIYIENRPEYSESKLFVYKVFDAFVDEYTIKDGIIIAERVEKNGIYREPKPFLIAPASFLYNLSKSLSKHLESMGGVETDQQNRGKIERYEDEVKWLRSLIEIKK